MIHRIKKSLFMGLCVVVIFSAASTPSQAGVVTDAWYALFGPPGSAWFPGLTGGYRTANYYPAAMGAGYYSGNPTYRSFGYSPFTYRPTQAFYAPCSPCGVIGGTCGVSNCGSSGSNCAVRYAPQTTHIEPTPQNNGDVPKTYLDDKKPESDSEHPASESEDSNFERKQKENEFSSTRKSEIGTSSEVQSGDFLNPIRVEAKKVPSEAEIPKSVIKQKKPAPPTLPDEDDGKSSPSGKSGSKTEKSQVEPLHLDHKFAGRFHPKRTRLVIRSRFENPVIVRTKVSPGRNWTHTLQGLKLAKQ